MHRARKYSNLYLEIMCSAATGDGQAQHFWKVGDKVYLSAYTAKNLRVVVPDRSLYLVRQRDIVILDGVL